MCLWFFTQDSWLPDKVESHKLMINVNDEWKMWSAGWYDYFAQKGWPEPASAMTLELQSRFDEKLANLKLQQQAQQRQMDDDEHHMVHPDNYLNLFVQLYIQKDKIGDVRVSKDILFFIDEPEVCFLLFF